VRDFYEWEVERELGWNETMEYLPSAHVKPARQTLQTIETDTDLNSQIAERKRRCPENLDGTVGRFLDFPQLFLGKFNAHHRQRRP